MARRRRIFRPVQPVKRIGYSFWYRGRPVGRWLCPKCGEPLYKRLISYYSIRVFCLACGWEEPPLTREQLLGSSSSRPIRH